MKKRGRRPADPESIRAAAFDLFVEKGFSATTIHDIAVRAGVSSRTVYRHFESKADIAVAETAANLARLGARVRSLPADIPLGPAIEELALTFARYLQDDSYFAIHRPQYAGDPTFNRRRIELVHAEGPVDLAKEFAAREGATEPRPEHLLAARILITILDQAVARWIDNPQRSLTEEVRTLLNVLKALFEEWQPALQSD